MQSSTKVVGSLRKEYVDCGFPLVYDINIHDFKQTSSLLVSLHCQLSLFASAQHAEASA